MSAVNTCPTPIGRNTVRALILLVVLSAPVVSQATVYCVENETQVQSTMDMALASSDALVEVHIKTGNYLFSSGDWGYFGVLQGTNKTLWISGGWSGSPGQCTTQDGDVASTVFWGLSQRKVFGFNASTTFTGSAIIENMTFGGGFIDTGSSASCLSLGEQTGGVMGIRLDRVWVANCTATSNVTGAAVSLASSASMLVRNSVFANIDAGGGLPLSVVLKAGVGYVLNNTIADNVSANVNGFVGLYANATNGAALTVSNNLLDGNVATAHARVDVLVGTGVSLQNNRFTGIFGVPVANIGSSTGSAGFISGSFQLSSSSTARDAGAFYAPIIQGVWDVAAQQRVRGSAIDLGALELQLLLEDSFESP